MNKIIIWLQKPQTWVQIAISLFIVSIIFLIPGLFLNKMGRVGNIMNILDKIIIPLWTGTAFSVAFSLTIRRTNAIEKQSQAVTKDLEFKEKNLQFKEIDLNFQKEKFEEEKQQFQQSQNQHKYEVENQIRTGQLERFEKLIRRLNDNILISLDAIRELNLEAIRVRKKDSKQAKRILEILCSFIKEYSNPNKTRIETLNNEWDGASNNEMVPLNIQQTIQFIFSRSDENPFRGFKITLTNCNLQHVDFSGLLMENVNFGGSAMHAALMYSKTEEDVKTEFINCKFYKSYLHGANMSYASFSNCDFTGAHMVWVNMFGAKMNVCNFTHADMTCSLLSKSNFLRCIFPGTILDGSDIYGWGRTEDNPHPASILKPVLINGRINDNERNVLRNTSLKFAFIYPHMEFFYSGTDKDSGVIVAENIDVRGIDNEEKIYINPENRLSRLIRYIEEEQPHKALDLPIENVKVLANFNDIKQQQEMLVPICKKAFKYAVPSDDLKLSSEELTRLKARIAEFINTHKN